MKKILIIISIIFMTCNVFAQQTINKDAFQNDRQGVYYMLEDRFVFDRYVAYIFDKRNLPADQVIIATAKFFLETPYVGHTLEIEPEGLVINLRQLDCTTFLETVYSLSMMVRSRDLSFDNYCKNLRYLRYRNGVISDYTDRLHYTTDWIYENQKKGILKDISRRAGGERLNFNLYIMSSNTDSYKQLKGNEELISKVKAKESEISIRKHYYLPTDKIDRMAKRIHSGDMVGLVSSAEGVDISHVGIIYKEDGKLTFIHASSNKGKVIINQDSLSDYLKASSRNKGIVLSRAKF